MERGAAIRPSNRGPIPRRDFTGRHRAKKPSYPGQVLIENRNGLVTQTRLTEATGTAERKAAVDVAKQIPDRARRWVTLGADKAHDTQDLVAELREMKVMPHMTQNQKNHASAIDGRTNRYPGYAISQRKRKRVEEIF